MSRKLIAQPAPPMVLPLRSSHRALHTTAISIGAHCRCRLAVLLVSILMPVIAQARLGEILPKLTKRFGRPYQAESTASNVVICSFHIRNGNFDVQVTLLDGVSVAETYFSTQPLQPNGEPPVEIVRGILQTNVPHARWVDRPARGGHEDSALATSDGQYGAWISNNGSWYGPQCTFVVSVFRDTLGQTPVLQSGPGAPPSIATPTATPLEPEVRARIVSDFHAEAARLLTQAAGEPWLKNHPASLGNVTALTPAFGEAVRKAGEDAGEFRRKIGDDRKTLTEVQEDTAIVESLKAYSEAASQLNSANAAKARDTIHSFSQKYPAIPGESLKLLWEAIDALQKLLDGAHSEAASHLEKATAFAHAGKTGSAVQEYQKAYEIFPDPAVTEQIKKLREESLGL